MPERTCSTSSLTNFARVAKFFCQLLDHRLRVGEPRNIEYGTNAVEPSVNPLSKLSDGLNCKFLKDGCLIYRLSVECFLDSRMDNDITEVFAETEV